MQRKHWSAVVSTQERRLHHVGSAPACQQTRLTSTLSFFLFFLLVTTLVDIA